MTICPHNRIPVNPNRTNAQLVGLLGIKIEHKKLAPKTPLSSQQVAHTAVPTPLSCAQPVSATAPRPSSGEKKNQKTRGVENPDLLFTKVVCRRERISKVATRRTKASFCAVTSDRARARSGALCFIVGGKKPSDAMGGKEGSPAVNLPGEDQFPVKVHEGGCGGGRGAVAVKSHHPAVTAHIGEFFFFLTPPLLSLPNAPFPRFVDRRGARCA